MRKTISVGLAAALVVAITASCGGGSTPATPTTPTPPTTPGPPTGNPSTATFTIGSDGRITPTTVTIAVGGRVTFVNNHNLSHDMSSNPHPDHNECPEINQVGFLTTGQQRTSGNLNTARTCGFHDHNVPENTALHGQIIVQ